MGKIQEAGCNGLGVLISHMIENKLKLILSLKLGSYFALLLSALVQVLKEFSPVIILHIGISFADARLRIYTYSDVAKRPRWTNSTGFKNLDRRLDIDSIKIISVQFPGDVPNSMLPLFRTLSSGDSSCMNHARTAPMSPGKPSHQQCAHINMSTGFVLSWALKRNGSHSRPVCTGVV
ncbi:hypothetical protein TorRG33x02_325460 [Trema orientale]|uniref:Uncharacterized protein n=1 Tax=Trema orientale TaxID=63057 RepID=A0A2P5BD03_TREOI|nr:hypothetical protein TorRG33x02_325460 [Trema orientale]